MYHFQTSRIESENFIKPPLLQRILQGEFSGDYTMDPSSRSQTSINATMQNIDEEAHRQLIARLLQGQGTSLAGRQEASISSAENHNGTAHEGLGEEIPERLEAARATSRQSNYTNMVLPLPGNAHLDHQIVALSSRFGRSEGSFLSPGETENDISKLDSSTIRVESQEGEAKGLSFRVMKLSREEKKRGFPLPRSRPKTWPKISLQRFSQTWEILQEEASLRPKIQNPDHFVRELFARKLQENTLVDRMYRKIHRLPSPTGFKRSSLKRNSARGPQK